MCFICLCIYCALVFQKHLKKVHLNERVLTYEILGDLEMIELLTIWTAEEHQIMSWRTGLQGFCLCRNYRDTVALTCYNFY